jgi:hypothetical protein
MAQHRRDDVRLTSKVIYPDEMIRLTFNSERVILTPS